MFVILFLLFFMWLLYDFIKGFMWEDDKSGPGDEEGTLYLLQRNTISGEYRAYEVYKEGRVEVDAIYVKNKLGEKL